MMNLNSMKLDLDVLAKVNGGSWTRDTLTQEERDYMDHLIMVNATFALDAFITRMDEKYGASGYTLKDFLD